jgi:hypothetical protein
MFETWLWVAAYGILAYVLLTMTFSSLVKIYYDWKIGYFLTICNIRKEMKAKHGELILPKGGTGKSPYKPN